MNTNSYLRFLLMVLADNSIEFSEIVGEEDAQTPCALLRDKNLRDLLEVLDDRERKIILQRFGLDGAVPKTLEEVGKKFGLTRERIRQLQNTALAKLRSRIRAGQEVRECEPNRDRDVLPRVRMCPAASSSSI
jgi:DNA-directed RNA polymerase sigma subunit (sigma70/sigma32)